MKMSKLLPLEVYPFTISIMEVTIFKLCSLLSFRRTFYKSVSVHFDPNHFGPVNLSILKILLSPFQVLGVSGCFYFIVFRIEILQANVDPDQMLHFALWTYALKQGSWC